MNRKLIVSIILIVFLLPLFFIISKAVYPFDAGSILNIRFPVIAALAGNTLFVSIAGSVLAFTIGLVCSAFVSYFRFPGRTFLESALCLPLAIPSYLLASVYKDLSHQYFRIGINLENPWGASIIFALSLYPYFFILLKMAFGNLSAGYSEAGKTLGIRRGRRLLKIVLPLAIPAIFLGLLLTVMEITSDYGTVNLLGVRTLTVGIYDTWFSMNNPRLASQLALLSFILPALVIFLFLMLMRNSSFYNPPARVVPPEKQKLSLARTIPVIGILAIPLAAGFVLPAGILASWAVSQSGSIDGTTLYPALLDTIVLAVIVGFVCTIAGIALSFLKRNSRSSVFVGISNRLINTQYAIPGIVTGISLLFLTGALYEFHVMGWLFDSIVLVVFACVLRFICFSYFSVENGMARIPIRLDEAAASIRKGRIFTLLRVHLPLLKSSVFTGGVLVFINSAKELTMSLVLQPFHYNSLSMKIYSFSRMDMLRKGAIYAILLIVILVYPVFSMAARFTNREKER